MATWKSGGHWAFYRRDDVVGDPGQIRWEYQTTSDTLRIETYLPESICAYGGTKTEAKTDRVLMSPDEGMALLAALQDWAGRYQVKPISYEKAQEQMVSDDL